MSHLSLLVYDIYDPDEPPSSLGCNARLSELGHRKRHEDVVAPDPDDQRTNTTTLRLTMLRSIQPGQVLVPTTWGFPFHEVCWRILEKACLPDSVPIQLLFDVCRSFPILFGTLIWGHGYGGLYLDGKAGDMKVGLGPGEEVPWGLTKEFRNTWVHRDDPLDIPPLQAIFEQQGPVGGTATSRPALSLVCTEPVHEDPFNRFSVEILQSILLYPPLMWSP